MQKGHSGRQNLILFLCGKLILRPEQALEKPRKTPVQDKLHLQGGSHREPRDRDKHDLGTEPQRRIALLAPHFSKPFVIPEYRFPWVVAILEIPKKSGNTFTSTLVDKQQGFGSLLKYW